ncbi:serine-threonine protein kinase 19-domain-containing protein [Dichotomocladium elegans]|nr:serine-threonine protein kinase 19-domain-containing protein [Dichotomocladium elegans]
MDHRRKRAQTNYAALFNRSRGHVPDVYGIRTRATAWMHQQQLKEEQEEDDDDDDDGDVVRLSDTAAAARYLIANAIAPQHRMSPVARRIPPMCAIHQIYSMLPGDNTTIDREMRALVAEGSWRKFHVAGTLEDELMVMRTEDYLASIESAKEEYAHDKEEDAVSPDVFDRFKDIVRDPKHRDLTLTRSVLEGFHEKEIRRLVNSNLILPHSRMLDTYWFAVRNNGLFMSSYRKGRVDMLRTLKKRRTKDILEKLLKEKKLKSTLFSHDFILHDLVGSGRAQDTHG